MLNLFKKDKEIFIRTPVDGEIMDIVEVNDPAFSSKMVGDGIAVNPINNIIKAPCDGKINLIFSTKHAFCLTTEEGIEILVHIGVDTVDLNGEGFKKLVENETDVKKGQGIIEIDLDYLKSCKKDITTMIVITNMDKVKSITKNLKNKDEVLKIKLKDK